MNSPSLQKRNFLYRAAQIHLGSDRRGAFSASLAISTFTILQLYLNSVYLLWEKEVAFS